MTTPTDPTPRPTIDTAIDPEPAPGELARLETVHRALAQVWDPELGIDIVSLGLVYDVRVDGDTVEVDMTLTTPGCPVSEQLPEEARTVLQAALPDARVVVNVVWDPPWSPANISPVAVERLRGRR
jgi:metal-sulfur cluster biosynthetic enzyme